MKNEASYFYIKLPIAKILRILISSLQVLNAGSLFIERASFYGMNMHNASRTLSRSTVLFPFQHDSRIISKRDRIRIRRWRQTQVATITGGKKHEGTRDNTINLASARVA